MDGVSKYLYDLKALKLDHPILVGFNISTAKDLSYVQSLAQGGIIGSAFIKYIGEQPEIEEACKAFVKNITKKIN